MSENVVYFLRASNGHIKIGTTGNLEQRIAALQCAFSGRLTTMRTVPGGRWVETWLHDRFKDRRLSGEWFTFDPDMLTVESPAYKGSSKGRLDPAVMPDLTSDMLAEALRKHLRSAKTADTSVALGVSLRTGIPERTVEKYLLGTSMPNGVSLLRLMAAFPALDAELRGFYQSGGVAAEVAGGSAGAVRRLDRPAGVGTPGDRLEEAQ